MFKLDLSVYEDSVINRTIVFNTFIFMQVFNEINSRKIDESMHPPILLPFFLSSNISFFFFC